MKHIEVKNICHTHQVWKRVQTYFHVVKGNLFGQYSLVKIWFSRHSSVHIDSCTNAKSAGNNHNVTVLHPLWHLLYMTEKF